MMKPRKSTSLLSKREQMRAPLSVAGNDYRLMLDALWSYNYVKALEVGRALEDIGFYWFEDPPTEDDLYNYVKLKQNLSIPIMATEMPSGGPTAYAPWVLARATDFLRGDVALKGSI